MILYSIEVSGWGSFAASCQVGPFSDTLNVLYAPNATGKSLLFEALRRGLLDGHRVTGQAIEALRPWGRSLAPTVTIEFSADGSVYRLEKRFLDGPTASLARREKGSYVPLAEGDEVTERVRALLGAETPGRGPTKREHWGQAQVLWAPQGQLSLPEDGLSGGLVAAIRASLAGQLAGGGGPLEARIEAAYDELFTPGGRLKSGKEAAPAVRLEDQRKQAQEERAIAEADQEELERLSNEVAGLRAAREQAKARAAALTEKLTEARAAAEAYATLVEQHKTCRANEDAARAKWELLSQRIDKLLQARERKAQAEAKLAELAADEEPLTAEVAAREQEAAGHRQQLERLRTHREELRAAEEEATAAARLANAVRDVEEAQRVLEAAAVLEQELSEQQALAASLLAPDEETIDKIRKVLRRRDRTDDKIAAARITLEVEPLSDGDLTILTAEQPQPGHAAMHAGETLTVRGAPEVAVELPGVAHIRAHGPAQGLAALRDERAQAEAELAELVAGYGSAELPILEERHRQRLRLESGLETLGGKLEATLSGRTRKELEDARDLAAARRDELFEAHPRWRKHAPGPDTLASAAVEARRTHEEEESELEAALAQAEQAERESERRLSTLREQITTETEKRMHAEQEVTQLSDDGRSDAERADLRTELALAWEAAKAKLEDTEHALQKIDGDPLRERERLERERDAADTEAQDARDKEVEAQALLQALTAGAPYDRLARAEEKLAMLEQQLEDARLRSDAIRLLRDSLHQVRRAAVAAVAGTVEEVAIRTLQRVSGPRLGRLTLGEHFDLHAITPSAATTPVELERLSGGEQEQVHFAVRLALAEVLARNERQLVVLDDVLIATDERRFPRVLEILEEAAQRLQLLILTCHPSRYSGLAGAHTVDLERALRTQTQAESAPTTA